MDEPPAQGTTYCWRGQGDPDWPLASSLERRILAPVGVGEGARAPAYEALVARHLCCFKTAACGMRGTSPKDLSDEQWWALGRHFGLHTPLLDWTEKPYIALFFALRGGPALDDAPAVAGERSAMYRLCHGEALAGDDIEIVTTPADTGRHRSMSSGACSSSGGSSPGSRRVSTSICRSSLMTRGADTC